MTLPKPGPNMTLTRDHDSFNLGDANVHVTAETLIEDGTIFIHLLTVNDRGMRREWKIKVNGDFISVGSDRDNGRPEQPDGFHPECDNLDLI
ncbi:hypothetical protein [Bifidobacterium sp. SO1]|uniref:hypothetical protein n=1 Tax=Bifidobacterium sp. SO1 TaxID=2809029 RepID=UPI001BDD0B0C|nr:hypothetical protein [Bifidobacterium sp. SO1]MBT1162170.1 hypothetical protein [Bifidobacterium sp. SO1]